jgi:hypothetical protein
MVMVGEEGRLKSPRYACINRAQNITCRQGGLWDRWDQPRSELTKQDQQLYDEAYSSPHSAVSTRLLANLGSVIAKRVKDAGSRNSLLIWKVRLRTSLGQ